MTARQYDERACTLGEGPLWHPLRHQLFWFDIVNNKLMTSGPEGPQEWLFDEPVSAAGWIDETDLLIASSSGLWRFDLATGARESICALEADKPQTRSNDGRADKMGGFWIGTMGLNAEPGAGAIYRFFKGELRKLFGNITISNSICFSPDGSLAYFSDTATGKVMRVALDASGWPEAEPEVFVDFSPSGQNPDGAVVDASGTVWIALWGAGCVDAFDPQGKQVRHIELPAHHVTCPAFGGENFDRLFVTSARQGLSEDVLSSAPGQGMTFAVEGVAKGLPEPQVLI